MKQKRILLLLLCLLLPLTACGAASAASPDAPVSSLPDAPVPSDEAPADEVSVTVGYFYQNHGLTLELPAGWEYEWYALSPDPYTFGVEIRPEGYSGELRFCCHRGMFGVCGTGLETRDIDLGNGLSGTMGTYDGRNTWDFIRFPGDNGADYAVQSFSAGGWWDEYGSTAMQILGTARLGGNVLTENKFLAAAAEAATVPYDTVRCVLDRENDTYTVHFSRSDWADEGQTAVWVGGDQTVYLDRNGSVLCSEYGE